MKTITKKAWVVLKGDKEMKIHKDTFKHLSFDIKVGLGIPKCMCDTCQEFREMKEKEIAKAIKEITCP